MKSIPSLPRTSPVSNTCLWLRQPARAGAACLLLLLIGSGAVAQTADVRVNEKEAVAPKTLSDPKEIIPTPVPEQEQDSPFQLEVGIPAWASALDGTVGVRGVTGGISESFSSLWNRVDWVAPLAVDARYQKWGFHLDGQIIQLSETLDTRGSLYLPGSVEMQQAFANFNLNYLAVDSERWQVSPSIGGRYNYLSLSGTLPSRLPAVIPDLNLKGESSWVDPIIGLNTTVHIYKPLSLQMVQDIGGFGVGSHFTCQLYGAARLQLARNFHMDLGYRYVYTNYSDQGSTYKVSAMGPQLTFGMKF